MELMEVKRVCRYAQASKHYSNDIYKVLFKGSTLAATSLHAFKVKKNDEVLYLPTHELKPGDMIYVDDYAFKMDGSLITIKEE